MKRVNRYAKHMLAENGGKATYDQCQRIYALMCAVSMEPVWADHLAYGDAVRLINTLEELHRTKRGAPGVP